MDKITAAPYVTQNSPMEVHQGAEYSQDVQVHRPKVSAPESTDRAVDETPSAVDIERNPKPKAVDTHDLTEPLQYVISAPDAIEKIEGLLEKIAEAWPALKPLVDEVYAKVNQMEAKVLGDEYAAHEAAEGEAPSVEQAPETARFASGDKVTVELQSETYNGTLTDKHEDGSWTVMTDNGVTLKRVPESDLHLGGKDSMMLPASLKGTTMKELEASLDKLVTAVKAEKEKAELAVEASVFDEMEEIDLGGGYIARRKKAKKKAEKKDDEGKNEKKEEAAPKAEEKAEEPVEASLNTEAAGMVPPHELLSMMSQQDPELKNVLKSSSSKNLRKDVTDYMISRGRIVFPKLAASDFLKKMDWGRAAVNLGLPLSSSLEAPVEASLEVSARGALYELEQSVREEVRERVKDGSADQHGDFIHEIADSNVPVYYSDLIALAAEDNSLATNEPELGPAFDGKPTPVNIIAANVYEHLTSIAYDEWEKAKKGGDEEEGE